VVVGPSAIAATIEAFAAGAALDWSEQVVVVATSPAARQLAAAATALLNASRPGTIVMATDAARALKRGARLVASPDADPADLARAGSLVAG
jgi:hypothetical protein